MKVISLLEEAAINVARDQLADGSFPGGHNGPYHDPETKVRNTAHWLYSFSSLYQLTGNSDYKIVAEKALDYLLRPEVRPMNATWWCRKNPQKDFSNGLVGQAWVIEALLHWHSVSNDSKLLDLCNSVYCLHPYDKKLHAWIRVNVDGSYHSPDLTFNHQLWFAMAGVLLAEKTAETYESVNDFLNYLENHVEIYSSGLIKHKGFFLQNNLFKKLKTGYLLNRQYPGEYLQNKSSGYHAFNTYALSVIRTIRPELNFFQSNKYKKIINYIGSDDHISRTKQNKYGYPYNPVGFESAYTILVNEDLYRSKKTLEYFIEEQFDRHYSKENHRMSVKTEDENTLHARLYELMRILHYQKDVLS